MKRPFFDKKYIDEVCEKYPTPFHIYDEKGIREGIRRPSFIFRVEPARESM